MQLTKPKMIIFDAGRTLINYKEINIRKGIEAYYPYIISNPHQYTVEEIEKYDDEIFGSFDPRSRFAALAERGKDKNRSHFQL